MSRITHTQYTKHMAKVSNEDNQLHIDKLDVSYCSILYSSAKSARQLRHLANDSTSDSDALDYNCYEFAMLPPK